MGKKETIEFEFDGRRMKAHKGQTIAEALLANGVTAFRRTCQNQPRGVFCGMGVCYECRAMVDGNPNVRTCMTPVAPGCKVETQKDDAIEVKP